MSTPQLRTLAVFCLILQDFRLLLPPTSDIDPSTVETNEEDWAFYVDFDQFVAKGNAHPIHGIGSIGIWASSGRRIARWPRESPLSER